MLILPSPDFNYSCTTCTAWMKTERQKFLRVSSRRLPVSSRGLSLTRKICCPFCPSLLLPLLASRLPRPSHGALPSKTKRNHTRGKSKGEPTGVSSMASVTESHTDRRPGGCSRAASERRRRDSSSGSRLHTRCRGLLALAGRGGQPLTLLGLGIALWTGIGQNENATVHES